MERLRQEGEHGFDTWLWKQYLFALEQENYCDFEVQFEIAHNAIHAWTGGSKEHSMAHLHFASYDPIFLLHHSSTDRIYAVWQELQRLRGHDPNEANCALELMREPLKPFSFGPPYNLDPVTKEFSKPEDVFNYKDHFLYTYDILDVQGVSVDLLQNYINRQKVSTTFCLLPPAYLILRFMCDSRRKPHLDVWFDDKEFKRNITFER